MSQGVKMLFAWSGLVMVGLVLLGARAVANGYLVVLNLNRYGRYLLERGADGRHHLFALYLLPVVLFRYLVLDVAYSLLLLQRRLQASTHSRKPIAVTAKL